MALGTFKNMILRIASTNEYGFTFNPMKNSFPDSGYAVASSQTQDCIGSAGLTKVLKFYLKNLDYCIGCWRNEKGVLQYDASRIFSRIEDAIDAARENGQRAIYDLNTNTEIMASDYHLYSCVS